jgi:hypothetical protein
MLDTLPGDVRHALEIRWEERLAFELLSVDLQHDCIGWIDEMGGEARSRRIGIVLDSLAPSSEPKKVERRYRDRLGALASRSGAPVTAPA